MTPPLHTLGIDKMSRDERLALVQDIWDTIADEPHPPLLSDAQRQELERRITQADAAPDDFIPWEEVKAQAIARLRNHEQ